MARGAAPPPLRAGDHVLDFRTRTLVMGILNATPDSFAGDGLHDDVAAVVDRAREFVDAGADLLDLGGESTRPNAVTSTRTRRCPASCRRFARWSTPWMSR